MTDDEAAEPFRVPPAECPGCGKVLEVAFCLEDEEVRPQLGSLTVCGFCIALLRFEDGGRLASVSFDEFSELPLGMQRYVTNLRLRAARVRAEVDARKRRN